MFGQLVQVAHHDLAQLVQVDLFDDVLFDPDDDETVLNVVAVEAQAAQQFDEAGMHDDGVFDVAISGFFGFEEIVHVLGSSWRRGGGGGSGGGHFRLLVEAFHWAAVVVR